ncbi:hypothetical protein LINGRAHAP2_LOCUS2454 [Linum grandiflorum]
MPPSFPLTSPPLLRRHYQLLPHHLRLRKALRPRTRQRQHSLQSPQPPHLPDLRPQARPRRQRPLNPPPDPSGDGDPPPHRFSSENRRLGFLHRTEARQNRPLGARRWRSKSPISE